MTKLQAIREFMQYAVGEYVSISRTRFDCNWGMIISNKTPSICIPKDLEYTPTEADKAFRKDFVRRCPTAQGFANVTLTLLHECGHWITRSAMDMIEYDKSINVLTDEEYFSNPWEMLATQWAICWLLCPENRKIAKDFEKKYFGRV